MIHLGGEDPYPGAGGVRTRLPQSLVKRQPLAIPDCWLSCASLLVSPHRSGCFLPFSAMVV